MKHLVGLGLVNHDTVACAEGIELDGKVRATRFFEQVGGPTPVALQCAARLGGVKTTQLGVIGGDSFGDDVARRLERFGVASSLQRTAPSTSRSLVLLDTERGTRIVASYAEELPPFRFDDDALTVLASADLLHLDGRDVPGAIFAAKYVRGFGGLVSLDLGTMRPGIEEIFPLCEIVLASRKGGAGAFPACANDPLGQVREFLKRGAAVAGVTLGADGVALGWRDRPEPFVMAPPLVAAQRHSNVAARPEQEIDREGAGGSAVVDTCGAGDAFHGAFCHAYLLGASPLEAADFAQVAVCFRIGRFGNEAGLPTLDEIPRRAGPGATAFRSESAPAPEGSPESRRL